MATIIDLLRALNQGDLPPLPRPAPSAPIPYAPVPTFPPLSDETSAAFAALNPEPMPPAIMQPSSPDRELIALLAGQAPTPPTPLSRGQRIANALIGFGAGVQGRGPQFLAQLQEPQREYQRQLERYQGRRTQALEFAQTHAEREQDRAQRAAQAQYQREYNIWLKKMDIRRDEADTRTKQAFDLLKIRETERIADEKLVAQQAQQNKIKLAELTSKYRQAGAKQYAGELAQKDIDPAYKLSPGAEKWESARVALEQARANRIAGMGGGGTGGGVSAKAQKALVQFEAAKQKLIDAAAAGNATAQKQSMTELNRAFRYLARFPEIETGFDPSGKWPYAKFRTPQGSVGIVNAPTAPQSQQNDPLGIR